MDERKIFNSIYLSLYLLCCFGEEISVTARYSVIFKLGALMLSFFPFFMSKKYRFSFLFFVLFLIIVFFDIIKGLFVPSVLYVIGGIPMAKFILLRKFNVNILYGCFFLMWIYFFRAGITDSLEDALTASVNFVSVFLLFNAICITIIVYNQREKVILFPSILCLIIALIAMGRSGIICSFLFVVGLLLIKIISISKPFVKRLLFFVIVVVVLSSTSAIVTLYENSESLERIRNRGFDDGARKELLDKYITSMNITRIVVGYNYTKDSIFRNYGDNPHNSYIKLHAHLGFVFLVLIYFIIRSMIIYLTRKEYVYILLILVLLIRAFTDIIFLNHFDFVLYMLIYPAFFLKYSAKYNLPNINYHHCSA